MHDYDDKRPILMSVEELKTEGAAIANEIKSAGRADGALRERFINVRAALFQRGIYDPVLVRFDSATAPAATAAEVAEQLAVVVEKL